MSNSNKIQAIPIKGKTLTTMTSEISGIDNTSGYVLDGIYEIKTSSFYSDFDQGFNAFNDDTNDYWECDNKDNANIRMNKNYSSYTQKPYSGITPSTYLGGGVEDNTWITQVGPSENKTDIEGEWIQIKLPYKLYLTDYSITTPSYASYHTFPVKFTLVASNDDATWDYIDQQYISELPSSNTPDKSFKVTTYNNYSYYRLIVTEMPVNTYKLRINIIKLMGVLSLNDVSGSESFTTLYRSIDGFTNRYNKRNEKTLDGADLYRPTYSNYNTIKRTEEKKEIKKNESVFLDKMRNTAENVLLYTGIFTGVFISGILINNMVKR